MYASFHAIEPAILNAISDESTVWYEPSTSSHADALHRRAGELAVLHRLLDALVDRRPEALRDHAADDLVDELVLDLPSIGSMTMWQSPNWPRPPVCFL